MGSLSDLKGRKTILMVTLIMCSISYCLMGLTASVPVILIIRAVLGIFKQTQMLTKALVTDFEKNELKQSEIYGKMAAISGIGVTLGPVIGGHIAEVDQKRSFMFIGVLVGICFLINTGIVNLLPQTAIKRKSRTSPNTALGAKNLLNVITSSAKQSVLELFKIEWIKYWDIFMFKAFVGFAMSVYYSNYALYLKTQYELSPKYVGYIISFQAVVASLSSYFINTINKFYVNDNDYSIRNFHVFTLLTTALIGLIFSYNIYCYTFWLIPLAIGNATGRLVTLEMLLARGHGEHRGSLIGASNSIRSLSGVAAPMIAGLIGQFFGVSYVIYASLLSIVTGLTISYLHMFKKLKFD